MLHRLALWLRSHLLRRRIERDMQDEMAEHLDRSTARLVARGMSARDARAAARREFGNVASLLEEARDARGWRWLYTVAGDLRFAARHFGKRPAVTVTIVFVLATGLSTSTALFSFMHANATQPPPGVPHADDMVRLRGITRVDGRAFGRGFTLDEYRAQEALRTQFRQTAAWTDQQAFLGAGDDAERRSEQGSVAFVTEHYFAVHGVRPTLGPGLVPEAFRPDAPLTGVISHSAWRKIFGGRADVVGRTVVVDGVLVTVAGVAPPRFSGVSTFEGLKVWMPLATSARVAPGMNRDAPMLRSAARLHAGVTREAASAAVALVAARIDAARPPQGAATAREEPTTDVTPLLAASGDPNYEQEMRMMSAIFTALGLLVLLVTCTNVSALVAGLGLARRKEVAVRLSLGAARARIVRQLVTESMLLAVGAGVVALGVVFALHWGLRIFAPEIPINVNVSWPATMFTFGVALSVGIAFGISPALHATRLSVSGVLKESSSTVTSSGPRMQRGLVVAQIAFTQPLVVGIAAMMLIILGEYRQQEFAAAADRIVSLEARMTEAARGASAEAARSVIDARRLQARLAGTPGVLRVVPDVQGGLRLSGYGVHPADRVPGGSERTFRMSATRASPGYLDVMGIPIVAGTDFRAEDTTSVGTDVATAGVVAVLIGDALARELWPGANPVGRRLVPVAEDLDDPELRRPALVVRGVADQMDETRDVESEGHHVTIPSPPDTVGTLKFMLRTRGNAAPMLPALRRIVTEELPDVASIDARTVQDLEAETRRAYVMITMMLVVGGGLSLLVAAIGLYAVVSLAVGQRTGEIAVRMAVGARSGQIARRFLLDGIRLGAIGLAVGLPLSLVGLRVALTTDHVLPAVGLGRTGAIAGVCVLLVAVAATLVPARRAAAVDPAIVLRGE